MSLPPGLLEPSTGQRLDDAMAGKDVARVLRIAELEVGAKGVLEAFVVKVDPIKPFNRKRGDEGLRGRVTLQDQTGEIDLVLWDEETRFVRDGTFSPGERVRIAGASVKAGFRGGLELGLGSARVEQLANQQGSNPQEVVGTIVEIGPARIVGEPPNVRIQADLVLRSAVGERRIALEGEVVRVLRTILVGQVVTLSPVLPHPVLDGWLLAGADCQVRA